MFLIFNFYEYVYEIALKNSAYSKTYLIVLGKGLSLIGGGQFLGRWSGLLDDPGNNIGSLTTAIVFYWHSITEEFQGGVATNLIFLGQATLNGGIDLAQFDVGFLFGQSLSGLGVFGG